ncbi:MAG TPA: hypothetical protein VNE83_03140 [Terriglobales bacterium]|nr:hypothetical protein [Terriglobales bacterium]
MTPAEAADHLHARPTGPGRWMARCPAHGDRKPSLSIAEGDGGRVLLHCWAGCTTAAVLKAAGLPWSDIMGAPTAPADRARLLAERGARLAADEAARAARREAAEAYRDLADRADHLAARLAALELAGATPAYRGEADRVAADYHTTMDALHEADAAWARSEVTHAA